MSTHSPAKTITLTTLALIAFAANSLLCRLALVETEHQTAAIDPTSFTTLRLVGGAIVLWLLLRIRQHNQPKQNIKITASWRSAISLFVYAVTFSYAYVQLETGTGALILFGSVQITMILIAVFNGHRLNPKETVGVLLAFVGLIYLMLPAIATPSFIGFVLMSISGIAWGLYSLQGAQSENGLADTAFNFLKSVPFVVILIGGVVLLQHDHLTYTTQGVIYALSSGALASGVGYAIWYSALTGLNPIQAAVVMLLVPLIAAGAGIVFLGEHISLRFMLASATILGGVLLVVLNRSQRPKTTESTT